MTISVATSTVTSSATSLVAWAGVRPRRHTPW
jgi:hypothetical protein